MISVISIGEIVLQLKQTQPLNAQAKDNFTLFSLIDKQPRDVSKPTISFVTPPVWILTDIHFLRICAILQPSSHTLSGISAHACTRTHDECSFNTTSSLFTHICIFFVCRCWRSSLPILPSSIS